MLLYRASLPAFLMENRSETIPSHSCGLRYYGHVRSRMQQDRCSPATERAQPGVDTRSAATADARSQRAEGRRGERAGARTGR